MKNLFLYALMKTYLTYLILNVSKKYTANKRTYVRKGMVK